MLAQTLNTLFSRDLVKLREEIALYRNENNLWIINKNISNSAGNLCLHLIGNLNAYIGAVLGNTGYIRNRDLEFSQKDVPKAELLEKIDATRHIVENVLNTVTNEQLNKEYPGKVFDFTMTTEYFLVHLSMHLAYHLGQINYHRRLLDV